MPKKNNNKIWNTNDMMNYAVSIYPLYTEIEEYSDTDPIKAYKREIRRNLEIYNLVKKDENTGKFIYELPEDMAKTFIESTMKDYFTDLAHIDNDKIKDKYSKEDKKLNEESYNKFVEQQDYLSECYAADIEPYQGCVGQDEIEKSILTMMIKAVFNIFYDFREEEYIKDFKELPSLVDNDDIRERYQEGYSQLKNKIDNPIKYYCTPKK